MKFCILMGSLKQNGHTAELCKPFMDELTENGAEISYITLSDKTILPCTGCYACQFVQGEYGCVQQDDMEDILKALLSSDCIVFATPIYSWYCTAPMKALLDRHFGLNKYFGSATGNLWEGKNIALITTHWYEAEYATEPFETGIKRFCKHCNLNYCGMLSAHYKTGISDFQTPEVKKGARDFARKLISLDQ